MKRVALLLLFGLSLTSAFAIGGKKQVPNAGNFPILVHVVYARVNTAYAFVDGQPVELTALSNSGVGLLAAGDYKARILKDFQQIGKPNGFDLFLGYELVLPDNTTRQYKVIGLGAKGGTFPGAPLSPSVPQK